MHHCQHRKVQNYTLLHAQRGTVILWPYSFTAIFCFRHFISRTHYRRKEGLFASVSMFVMPPPSHFINKCASNHNVVCTVFCSHQWLQSTRQPSGWEAEAILSCKVSIHNNKDISVSGQNCLPCQPGWRARIYMGIEHMACWLTR